MKEVIDKNVWRPIDGYDGYFIDVNGNVFSSKRNKLLKPRILDGYYKVTLSNNGKAKCFFVHRLIAISFMPNPQNKPCINHKNSIRLDNSLDNLEWVTHAENIKHSWDYGYATGNTGYKHTDYSKNLISKKKKGLKLSDEHKLNISKGMRRHHNGDK